MSGPSPTLLQSDFKVSQMPEKGGSFPGEIANHQKQNDSATDSRDTSPWTRSTMTHSTLTSSGSANQGVAESAFFQYAKEPQSESPRKSGFFLNRNKKLRVKNTFIDDDACGEETPAAARRRHCTEPAPFLEEDRFSETDSEIGTSTLRPELSADMRGSSSPAGVRNRAAYATEDLRDELSLALFAAKPIHPNEEQQQQQQQRQQQHRQQQGLQQNQEHLQRNYIPVPPVESPPPAPEPTKADAGCFGRVTAASALAGSVAPSLQPPATYPMHGWPSMQQHSMQQHSMQQQQQQQQQQQLVIQQQQFLLQQQAQMLHQQQQQMAAWSSKMCLMPPYPSCPMPGMFPTLPMMGVPHIPHTSEEAQTTQTSSPMMGVPGAAAVTTSTGGTALASTSLPMTSSTDQPEPHDFLEQQIQQVELSGQEGHAVARSRGCRKPGRARLWLHIYLHMEADGFDLVPRLIGRSGCNMKKIFEATGAKLRIRGRGSGHLEVDGASEAPTPLMVAVTSDDEDADSFRLAVQMTERELKSVAGRYRVFCEQQGIEHSGPCYSVGVMSEKVVTALGSLARTIPVCTNSRPAN